MYVYATTHRRLKFKRSERKLYKERNTFVNYCNLNRYAERLLQKNKSHFHESDRNIRNVSEKPEYLFFGHHNTHANSKMMNHTN